MTQATRRVRGPNLFGPLGPLFQPFPVDAAIVLLVTARISPPNAASRFVAP